MTPSGYAVDRTVGGSGIFLARRAPSAARATGAEARGRGDAVVALTVVVTLLIAIPARLAFRTLGGAGNPALLVGMLLFVWYVGVRLVAWQRPVLAGSGVRTLLGLFGMSVLASYVAAMTRPISGEEVRAADRGLLIVVAALGIALSALDGPPDRARLKTLLRRIATGGAILALLGLLQYYAGFDVTRYIRFPGLSDGGQQLDLIGARDGLRRVSGTASHPIEFGVVLGVLTPIALHFAFQATSKRARRRAWLRVGLIGAALPLAISRSGVIALVVGLAVLLPTWPRRRRRAAYVVMPLCVVAIRVTTPGVVGTIISLFTNVSSDDSTTGRTTDYQVAGHYIGDSPLFGRGYGTFLPDKYRILDNAYLGHTIETGFVGLVVLLALFAGTFVAARRVRRVSRDETTRDLAQCLAASVLAAGVTFVTFDALGYVMVLVVVFLLIGCVGGLARLVEPAAGGTPLPAPASPSSRVGPRPHPGWWDLPRLAWRRWYLTVAVVGVSLFGLNWAYGVRGAYEASASVAVLARPTGQGNPYEAFNLTSQTVVQLIAQRVAGRDLVVNLVDRGTKAQYAVSAEHLGTDENPAPPPAPGVSITAWSSDPATALAEMNRLVTSVGNDLNGVQNSVAAPSEARLGTLATAVPGRATLVAGSRARAVVAMFLVAVLCLLYAHCLAERAAWALSRWRARRTSEGGAR